MLLKNLDYNQLLTIVNIPCRIRMKDHKNFTKGIFKKRYNGDIYFLSNNDYYFGTYPTDMLDSNYKYGWYCINPGGKMVDDYFEEFIIDINQDKIEYGEL